MAALYLFLGNGVVISQTASLSLDGTVYDAESKAPLVGAIVTVLGKQDQRTATDQFGKFSIPVFTASPQEIQVTYLGFKPIEVTVTPDKQATIQLEPDEKSLGTVEVRSERIRPEGTKSLSIESIDRETISRNQTASLGTLLGNIQGVTFASFGSNIQLPIIHGLYGNRILILNNGFKHGFQNWGSDHAPEIDIQSAESISVIKGAAAVRFGPDALGGAVVTESHSMPFNNRLSGSAVAGFQTNGRGFNTGLNLAEGFENFSWHLGGNVTIVGDRHAPDYMLTNTGAREYSAYGGAKFKINNNLIAKANYSFMRQNLGILRASIGSSGAALIRNFEADRPVIIRDFSYDINEPNQFVSHHLASLKLDWNINPDNHVGFRYVF
jgi:iron complex outermembrane receptor protein